MAPKITASEIIRKTALKILAQYPEGLQLNTLRMFVEQELKDYIEPDTYNKGKYRSALWNLDRLFPEYVNLDPVTKRFWPTKQLQDDFHKIEVPNLDEYLEQERLRQINNTAKKLAVALEGNMDQVRKFNFEAMQPRQRVIHIQQMLLVLNDKIEELGMKEFLDLFISHPEEHSKEEIEAAIRLKFLLQLLSSYKSRIFFDKF
jgi:hypothetical protein